ncbi:MAG: hypothetical protein HC930_03120 [Hydrococcus sp. SU_1_0]|nr:hypothetical protein [Hydrococcus sp. SU_1_0]
MLISENKNFRDIFLAQLFLIFSPFPNLLNLFYYVRDSTNIAKSMSINEEIEEEVRSLFSKIDWDSVFEGLTPTEKLVLCLNLLPYSQIEKGFIHKHERRMNSSEHTLFFKITTKTDVKNRKDLTEYFKRADRDEKNLIQAKLTQIYDANVMNRVREHLKKFFPENELNYLDFISPTKKNTNNEGNNSNKQTRKRTIFSDDLFLIIPYLQKACPLNNNDNT